MPRFNFNVHSTIREHGRTIGDGMASGEVEAPDRETARARAVEETTRTYRGRGTVEPFHTVVSEA